MSRFISGLLAGVCSSVVIVSVSKFTGLCVRGVIELSCRGEFSGRVRFRGKGRDRHAPVEGALQRSPLLPACGLLGEFRVFGASVL